VVEWRGTTRKSGPAAGGTPALRQEKMTESARPRAQGCGKAHDGWTVIRTKNKLIAFSF
jgi:hypothetical protein